MSEQILSLEKIINNAYTVETEKYKFILNKVGIKGMYISVFGKESKTTIGFYSMSSIVYIFENHWNSIKALKRLFTDLVLKTPHRMKKIEDKLSNVKLTNQKIMNRITLLNENFGYILFSKLIKLCEGIANVDEINSLLWVLKQKHYFLSVNCIGIDTIYNL